MRTYSRLAVSVALAAALGSAAAARELTKEEKAAISKAIQEQLKDPESIRITWEPLHSDETYCGTVNARNSFGGYVGDAPFIVTLKRIKGRMAPIGLDIGDPRDSVRNNKAIMDACLSEGYSLVLSGTLPSALAQRQKQSRMRAWDGTPSSPSNLTPEQEIEASYDRLQHRLDRSEGVCKTKTGDYVAMAQSACAAQGGRVLGN
ncbi:hypothetical protein [Azospirillum argentinense]|uniref:Uncharacterized protein n=1 Tax=Azospirillum argentinense TaxID=2970906 RepID=A0A5B0KMH0_9PROT|nr:hypothetical protein [Azospirillum argentinense]KAA1053792.1 hypothetical protein FH063_002374 [Azospirillum argentinense]